MNFATVNYPIPEQAEFADTVKRAAAQFYARLLRVHNANTNTVAWICSRANQLKDTLRDSAGDKRLADMLFVFTACRSKGEAKNVMQQKIQDVANDYTQTFGFEQLNKRSIELMIWRFFVVRELYYILAGQLLEIEAKTGQGKFSIKEFVISPCTLQKEFERLSYRATPNN